MNIVTKICSTCKTSRPISEFYKDSRHSDGLFSACKTCSLKFMKQYGIDNKELIRQRKHQRYLAHREERLQTNHQWYQQNKKRAIKQHIEYSKRKRRIDSKFKLSNDMRNGMYRSLKQKKSGLHWERFVSFTVKELEKYLRKTIPIGFTWEDYMNGKLHIDHRLPLSAFNYSKHTDIDFKRAWALDNLRFLPALENLKKAAKIEIPFQPSLRLGGINARRIATQNC